MINDKVAVQYANDLKCEVCGAAISFPESLKLKDKDYLVCQSFDCQRIMDQKSSMPPLLFKAHLQSQRKFHDERMQKEETKLKYIKETEERECRENQTILQIVLDNKPHLSKDNTPVLTLPKGLSRLVSLSEQRRNNYAEHLDKIIRQAIGNMESSEVEIDQHLDIREKLQNVEQQFKENPALRTISDNLCTMCKGGCCTSGRDHAYLSAITIRRYLDTNPDLSAEDLLTNYISHLASETIDGACINQTIRGCSLPKELRSDICNYFYCDSLKSYQDNMRNEEQLGTVLAIQRAGSCWNWFGPEVGNEVTDVALVEENDIEYQEISMEIMKKKNQSE